MVHKFQLVFPTILFVIFIFSVCLPIISPLPQKPPRMAIKSPMIEPSELPARDVRLKAIPSAVMNILFDVQNDLRKKAGRHVSMEKAFCRLVREYKELKQKESQ